MLWRSCFGVRGAKGREKKEKPGRVSEEGRTEADDEEGDGEPAFYYSCRGSFRLYRVVALVSCNVLANRPRSLGVAQLVTGCG